MFPKTNIKSAGNNTYQNEATGVFHGHIAEMRAIKSPENKTLFGVIEIKADNERKPFYLYLNYNPEKAQKSVSWLVGKTKELIFACGETPDMEAERDPEWCENIIKGFEANKTEFWFKQEGNKQDGFDIEFLEHAPQTAKTEF